MPAVAVMQPYTLVLREDEDAGNPREDSEPFGKMICFHSRYSLGDKHDYEIPEAFAQSLVRDTVSAKDICDFAAAGKSESVRLSQKGEIWEVTALYYKHWETVATFINPIAEREETVSDVILEYMDTAGLFRLAEYENIILPLHLLDHSGLSMSTGSFGDKWDSGQVGWIYANKGEAAAALGIPKGEVENRATEIMESEVSEYNSYIRGECYGFQLYQNGMEVDSCWGFVGSPDALKADIESYLPDDCKGVMDNLEYMNGDADVDKFLLEQEREPEYMEGDNNMSTTEISMEARAYPFTEPKGNQLGYASVTLNGGFALTGIKIMEGKNGPFVAMPSAKDGQGGYRDVFFPITKELREQLNGVVMDAHNTAIEKMIADRVEAKAKADERLSAAKKLSAPKKPSAEERPSATEKLDAAKKEAAKASESKDKTAPAKVKGKGDEAI